MTTQIEHQNSERHYTMALDDSYEDLPECNVHFHDHSGVTTEIKFFAVPDARQEVATITHGGAQIFMSIASIREIARAFDAHVQSKAHDVEAARDALRRREDVTAHTCEYQVGWSMSSGAALCGKPSTVVRVLHNETAYELCAEHAAIDAETLGIDPASADTLLSTIIAS
ncbi:MAG: hypothetical protein ACYCV4_02575 [Dermatophilaceae bacterium]